MGSVTAGVALVTLVVLFVIPHQTFYRTPAFNIPKLYANTVYMVLNSRIRIMGGRKTYTSSTDMSITTTMISDDFPLINGKHTTYSLNARTDGRHN
ncbi:hypothetical protein IW261DRAFT_800662 [Armillaria novae-zelandiae]|uniref:Uncharacterized protein n=1 Tax=Armillaria novae-zelandiae TaxID=153914 RepID=A0AA39TFQ8_9AGAR|nr:hypothetical protein IW261DRAFT_800662 [Armillaria novae-zelandiae]